MLKQTWPALKACKLKLCRASDSEVNDRLSLLPDEILLSILSSFTLKEAARTSLLSHRWKDLWRCLSALVFEDTKAMTVIFNSFEQLGPKRSGFINWVNNVMNKHMGSAVDELRVAFDLDSSCQSHINEWVDFAFEKHVKRLDLNFLLQWPNTNSQHHPYTLPLERLPRNNNRSLTSLSLEGINVTTEFIEHILLSFPLLHNLCLVRAHSLTRITAPGSPLGLQYLEVFNCHNLETIHISTPKLLSFKFFGMPIKLHIENASLLSEVFVGVYNGPIGHSLGSLFKYFSQLGYLGLRIGSPHEMNLTINQVPNLAKLKHLHLKVSRGTQSLLGWTFLIEASPVLQKLTLEMSINSGSPSFRKSKRPRAKRDGQPLRCLKTLELFGFLGLKLDLEFAIYVFEKALVLEEVIVDFRPWQYNERTYLAAQKRIKKLKKEMPRGAELIFKSISRGKNAFDSLSV